MPSVLKSTDRVPYDEARHRAGVGAGGVFDVLLYNERLELTESSITNVAVETDDGSWATPPCECGLLNGVLRARMLSDGVLQERVVRLSELETALAAGRRLLLLPIRHC